MRSVVFSISLQVIHDHLPSKSLAIYLFLLYQLNLHDSRILSMGHTEMTAMVSRVVDADRSRWWTVSF